MQKYLQKKYKMIIFLISVVFVTISLINANNDAATFDEIAHIPAGYSYLTQHEIRLNPEHPPLIKNISALPLLFMDLSFDTTQPFWTGNLPKKWDEGQWTAGRHLLWEAGNNPDKIIFWSRVPIVLLSLLLGLFIFKWTKELAGITAGLFALTLYFFDPNILGHNHFVTTDIGVMVFLTFSFYYFIKFIKKPSWKNATLGGFFWGLLHLAKFSSIITLPIFGLVLIAYPLLKKLKADKNRTVEWFTYLKRGSVAFLISFAMIWVSYTINTFNATQEVMSEAIDFNFSPEDKNPKNIYTNEILHSLNGNIITRPLVEYGIGMGYVFRRVAGGNGAYFMGEVSDNAFLSYFPTVFLLKETIPFLLLILLTSIFTIYQIISSLKFGYKNFVRETFNDLLGWLRTGVTQYTLFGFIIFYSYLSVTGNLNIGLRHLFPIFPFIYILVAKKVHDFFKETHNHKLVLSKYLFSALLIWLIFEPIANYPYYMSYFNQFAGGPKNGYNYVTDSNADWGQDLKRLENFLDQHPEIDKIRVDYFGGGNPKYYLGNKYIQWWDSKRPIEKGWYAVSTNFLQGSIYDTRLKDDGTPRRANDESWRWTLDYTPKYQVGTSIFIYYVE